MDLKTKAIVMGAVDKGESDKRVRLFSVDAGVLEATARGVKKQGAKLSSCTFCFAFVEVVLAEKNGFFTVTASDMIEPFSELSYDLDKFQLASSALEIVAEIVKGNEDNSKIFVELLNLFKLLSFSNSGSDKLLWCKWAIDMLSLAGYKIDPNKCNVCGKKAADANNLFIDMESGSVFCEIHKPIAGIMRDITSGEFRVLSGFSHVGLENMAGRSIKDESVKEDDFFDFVKRLVEGILGKKLKSILL
ncbi:MAG: DNA repair protein RecO [Clostridia bacterium]|nr:DNA repair protein RecO [Clostridia bacterium]